LIIPHGYAKYVDASSAALLVSSEGPATCLSHRKRLS